MSYTKNKQIYLILSFLFLISYQTLLCQEERLDSLVQVTIQKYKIPGAAIAIIKDGSIIYKRYTGDANLDYKVPVTKKSLFRLHSLSKIFVSVGIFQLFEQEKLSLDDPISMYVEGLPESWKPVKIENLLSHSSGLPDITGGSQSSEEEATKAVFKRPIQFAPGERTQYNQSNFWLLNKIIQKVSKKSLNEFIIDGQFEDEKRTAFFSNTSEIVEDRITEYKPNKTGALSPFYFYVPEYMYGAAGMTISLDAFVRWNNRLENQELINERSKRKMLTPFSYQTGNGLTLGWNARYVNESLSYGVNGGGLTNYRIYPRQKIAIIWLTNGFEIPYDLDRVVNGLAGIIDPELIDPAPKIFEALFEAFDTKSEKVAYSTYTYFKKKHPYVDFQSLINGLGYQLMEEEKFSKAISVFKLNTVEFPNSANVFDSLGEVYFVRKTYDKSALNYQKAVALGGTNGNAKRMLERIQQIKKK